MPSTIPLFVPLTGVRVLDLSRYLPGPFLTRILCDLGAEVVQIEPLEGEGMRSVPPRVDGMGATFAALHADKDSVALDLKAPEGLALLRDMALHADVLIEGFRPGKLAALGLEVSALQAEHPGLIVCSITGYGQLGSRAQEAGHDLNYLATSGLLSLFGPPDAPPTVPGVQLADVAGGSLPAAIAILAALLERQQTGRGRALDISMTHGVLALAANAYPPLAAGSKGRRGRDLLTGGAPAYRCYRTQDDRFVALAGVEPAFFGVFCQRIGFPEWASFSYRTDSEGQKVAAALEALFLTRPAAEWIRLCEGLDCCLSLVRTPQEALADPELCPPLHALGALSVVSSALGAPTKPPQRPPSALGADAEAVFQRWGIPQTLVDAARSASALG